MRKKPESANLGLPTLDPEQTILTIEDLKRLIADRATYMGVDYHWADIQSVEDAGCTYVFLKRCNPRLREIEIAGFPTVAVNEDGEPITDWDYPLYVEYNAQAPIMESGVSTSFYGRVILRIPQLVIVVFEDGTIKDGADEKTYVRLEQRRQEYFRNVVRMAERDIGRRKRR